MMKLAIPQRSNWKAGFDALASFLTAEVGTEVDLALENDFEAVLSALMEGRAAFGLLTSTAYIRAKTLDPGLHYLATARAAEAGETPMASYHGDIIVRVDSPIREIADLSGKSFAFVSPSSSSGYRYPAAFLKAAGIDPHRALGTVMFMGDHPFVTDVVAAGIADAGATWEGNLSKAINKHGNVFRSLGRYGPLVNHAFVAIHSVSSSLRAKVSEALCRLPESVLKTEGFPYAGFEILSDSAYDAARQVEAEEPRL